MAEDPDFEVSQLKESLKNTDNELARKDKLISELVARLREYEMGEYGLSEAVGEIKECRRIIRVREREIETLTDQLNVSKLQLLDLREKFDALEAKPKENDEIVLVPGKKTIKKKYKKVLKLQPLEKLPGLDKACQCYRSVYPLNCLKDITATQVQNEWLRGELSKVCEEAMESLIATKKDYQKNHLKNEVIIHELKENLKDFEERLILSTVSPDFGKQDQREVTSEMEGNGADVMEAPALSSYKLDPEDCYKVVQRRIEMEDLDVQEIFHELAGQIKILKKNQEILIRRYIALSDREANLFKDNQHLKEIFTTDHEDRGKASFGTELETFFGRTAFGNQDLWEEISAMHSLYSSDETDICPEYGCVVNRNNVTKLVDFVIKLTEEVSKLKKMLEISRHQTKALEKICFDKETELRALGEQLILFQIQSDERMLLGKLAIKILQLQFSNAAFAYELNKYKLDKTKLEEWYSMLLKDHEDNEVKLCTSYTEAYSKLKHLAEILEDVGHRCSEAIAGLNIRK